MTIKDVSNVLTLHCISNLLVEQNSLLNQGVEEMKEEFVEFREEMRRMQQELENKKMRDRVQRVDKRVGSIVNRMERVFELINKSQQSLHNLAEEMATKEINRDPIDYIRKESVLVKQADGDQDEDEEEESYIDSMGLKSKMEYVEKDEEDDKSDMDVYYKGRASGGEESIEEYIKKVVLQLVDNIFVLQNMQEDNKEQD